MSRPVIGVDPGRQVGMCIIEGGKVLMSHHDLGQASGKQLMNLYDRLQSVTWPIIKSNALLVHEDPAQMKGRALIQIQRQIGVIQYFAEEWNIAHYPVNQQTLKAWAKSISGIKTTMDKDAMILAANVAGVAPATHDEADAYWLARYGAEMVLPILDGK